MKRLSTFLCFASFARLKMTAWYGDTGCFMWNHPSSQSPTISSRSFLSSLTAFS
jgi:hypothetical protein